MYLALKEVIQTLCINIRRDWDGKTLHVTTVTLLQKNATVTVVDMYVLSLMFALPGSSSHYNTKKRVGFQLEALIRSENFPLFPASAKFSCSLQMLCWPVKASTGLPFCNPGELWGSTAKLAHLPDLAAMGWCRSARGHSGLRSEFNP